MIYCPKCKEQTLVPYMGWNFGTYLCKACGYIGPLCIEVIPNQKKEASKKKRKSINKKEGKDKRI